MLLDLPGGTSCSYEKHTQQSPRNNQRGPIDQDSDHFIVVADIASVEQAEQGEGSECQDRTANQDPADKPLMLGEQMGSE